WNEGNGEEFAAPFADDADFIAFEGTHLEGRRHIAAFHQELFDSVVQGMHLEGSARFVRFVSPVLAVVHGTAGTVLPGQYKPSVSRDSMQLFVATKHGDRWSVDAVLNARRLPLQRQAFWDDFESLSEPDQHRVMELVSSLKHRAAASDVAVL